MGRLSAKDDEITTDLSTQSGQSAEERLELVTTGSTVPTSHSKPKHNKRIATPDDTGRTSEQSEGDIPDADFAALVTAWPTLPESIRRAVLALVASTRTD